LSPVLLASLVITLAAIVALAVWTGAHNTKKKGEGSNAAIVAGVIIGTLVGGSSTVGTAQLAYTYGMSAWWFTLGAGISCLVLGLVYTVPLRQNGERTLVGMIRKEYGQNIGMTASVLNSVGTFINIISQILSATAVVAVIAPNLGIAAAAAFSAAFMVLYVVFGGTRGAGVVGIVKTILLYVAMMACGVLVLQKTAGFGGFVDMVKGIDNPEGVRFFSLLARGAGKDLGSALSLLLGVLTTQTYAQGVLSARSDAAGKAGALLSAFLIPPIGIGGILVGLYMRAHAAAYPGMTAKTALTTFITAHVPPALAGVVLAGLFIAAVGTGAGLALGISTMLNNDIVPRLIRRKGLTSDGQVQNGINMDALGKLWIILVLAAACVLSCGSLGDIILQFAFMSMGLRAAVVFMPLLGALWLPGKADSRWILASIVLSPAAVFAGKLLGLPFDSLFLGMAVSAACFVCGLAAKKNA
jgi:SSS family solute:Na+ symporter